MATTEVISFALLLMFAYFNPIFSTTYYNIKSWKLNITKDITSNYSFSIENNVVSGQLLLNTIIDRKKEKRISIHLQGFKFVRKEWQTWLVDGEMDICDAMDFVYKPNANFYIDWLRPEIKKFTNLNHTCPFGPNELFLVNNFDANRLLQSKSSYFMKGLYKFEAKGYLTEFDKLCMNILVEVEIKNALKKSRDKG